MVTVINSLQSAFVRNQWRRPREAGNDVMFWVELLLLPQIPVQAVEMPGTMVDSLDVQVFMIN